MSIRMISACAVASCALLVHGAHAGVTFSFASDDFDGPTFYGAPSAPGTNNLFDGDAAGPGTDPVSVNLLVFSGGTVNTFNTIFEFSSTTTDYQQTPVFGVFLHTWLTGGSFNFSDAMTGDPILTINYSSGVLNSVSSSDNTMGGSASLQAAFDTDPTIEFLPGQPLIDIGVTPASVSAQQSFGFTLTSIAALDGSGLPGINGMGDWTVDWISEGSFSASAVPAPGAFGLLAVAFAFGRRRRR